MIKVFNLLRNVWKDFMWGVLFAALGVLGALLFLEQTSYAYWIERVLSNGHGPYEISIATIVITLAILNAKKISNGILLAIKASNTTIIDIISFASFLWGLFWLISPILTSNWGKFPFIKSVYLSVWIGGLAWLLVRIFYVIRHKRSKLRTPQESRWLSDRPIGLDPIDEDVLGRENMVRQITSITREYAGVESLVVAITGKWGDGKTSVLNMARKQLEKDDGFIIVMFNPWYFASDNEQGLGILLKRFFDALDSTLKSKTHTSDWLTNLSYQSGSPCWFWERSFAA
jgi:hypothetical protein